jgi:hypothetical protein
LLNFIVFNETSFTQVSSSPSQPIDIDSKALLGLGLYTVQVWKSLRQTHSHTYTHTHDRTPLDIYQLEAGTFTHNTQQRQTFMPPPDSNPQIRQLNGCKPTSSSQSLTKLNKRKHRTFPTSLSNSKFRCFEVKCVPQT